MYNTNSSREDKYKSRRHSKNKPSFSSTLLDQIYSSIDANAEDNIKPKKDLTTDNDDDDDDDEVLQRRPRPTFLFPEDNNCFFFSSTSSDSSSDTEFFANKSGVSCLSIQTRPKPIPTAESQITNKSEDDMIKFKSRASKIYANFRKVKQPISPGGRLTSFLNSLFHNAKGKNLDPDCSKSCLSGKSRNGNIATTVKFNPTRACGHKCIYREISDKFGRPPLPHAELKNSSSREGKSHDALRGIFHIPRDQDIKSAIFAKTRDCDEDDGGALSDSSSDLFELDHLSQRFCEELPVYETTRLDTTKRASVSRLIR